MYLSELTIESFRCFGSGTDRFNLCLQPGLTALVGQNDAGKSAIIDALRFALGTTDQEWYRLDKTDFRAKGTSDGLEEIKITCKFEGLEQADKRAFVEYLTYGEGKNDPPVLYVNWTASDAGTKLKGQPYRRVDMRSGKNGEGPKFDSEVRELLRAVYLRPLRDAEQALSAGRGSRLARVLQCRDSITQGADSCDDCVPLESQDLSVLGICDLINSLLEGQKGIKDTTSEINENLKELTLRGDRLKSNIKVSGARGPVDARLRELLEKLDLRLVGAGRLGLGSNNILFMACELLLLAVEAEGLRLLLIEEPEAHVHAQRQLRIMKYLQDQAKAKSIQIIVTTHSPNLASAIKLDNLVMVHSGHAYSMANGQTKLQPTDYGFLERFLDVTKANLFFACAVVIVEGDAENILLPTLARLLDRDFTEHGVSVVNVGGVGLRRYARIFQSNAGKGEEKQRQLAIPVACVADMDVMPDCAPVIIGKLDEEAEWPAISNHRKWRAKRDFTTEDKLLEHRSGIRDRASGQSVETFVSDEWTLEYDLALGPRDEDGNLLGGLAEDVYVAACLAEQDDQINAGQTGIKDAEEIAAKAFADLKSGIQAKDRSSAEEVLASHVYAKFTKDGVSKAITAQYLADRLDTKKTNGTITAVDLRNLLPKYITEAINYVTSVTAPVLPVPRAEHPAPNTERRLVPTAEPRPVPMAALPVPDVEPADE